MSRIASASLVLLILAVACRDDVARRPDNPVAPDMAVATVEPALDTSSSVCRAYAREYAAARSAKDNGTLDPLARQRFAALSAVIDDACR